MSSSCIFYYDVFDRGLLLFRESIKAEVPNGKIELIPPQTSQTPSRVLDNLFNMFYTQRQ